MGKGSIRIFHIMKLRYVLRGLRGLWGLFPAALFVAMKNLLLDPGEDGPEMVARKQLEQAKLFGEFAKSIGLQPQ